MYLEEREVAGERRLGIVLDTGEWRALRREPYSGETTTPAVAAATAATSAPAPGSSCASAVASSPATDAAEG